MLWHFGALESGLMDTTASKEYAVEGAGVSHALGTQ